MPSHTHKHSHPHTLWFWRQVPVATGCAVTEVVKSPGQQAAPELGHQQAGGVQRARRTRAVCLSPPPSLSSSPDTVQDTQQVLPYLLNEWPRVTQECKATTVLQPRNVKASFVKTTVSLNKKQGLVEKECQHPNCLPVFHIPPIPGDFVDKTLYPGRSLCVLQAL